MSVNAPDKNAVSSDPTFPILALAKNWSISEPNAVPLSEPAAPKAVCAAEREVPKVAKFALLFLAPVRLAFSLILPVSDNTALAA